MQTLAKGANAPLPPGPVAVRVTASAPVDVSAVLVARGGKVRGDADFVFYNQPEAPGVRWKVRAVGQGHASGLAGIATDFGITVEDESAPAPPPAPAEKVTPDKGKVSLRKRQRVRGELVPGRGPPRCPARTAAWSTSRRAPSSSGSTSATPRRARVW